MKQEFEELYKSLESTLQEIAKESPGSYGMKRSIDSIKKVILVITHPSKLKFKTKEEEIEFFRIVWPKFYGKLFLYIKLYKFEIGRNNLPSEFHSQQIKNEGREVAQFFRPHAIFAFNYQSGSPSIDFLFTRKHNMNDNFEDLSLVLDAKKCTYYSYIAACCLANWEYRAFLDQELPKTRFPDNDYVISEGDYTWELSDADFVEWLYGLHELKAIKYKGQSADISRLQKWSKWALGKEVVNIYDRFKVLRSRKKERIPFTKRTGELLERRMDQADGKYE